MAEFNALNGEEMKRVLLHEIEQALNEVADFRVSVALPVVRWEWTCKLSVYPRDPQDINIQKSGEVISADATNAEKEGATETVLEGFGASGASGMEAPDLTRERVGLPVPTLRTNKRMGVAYHEMVERPATDEESWTPPGVRAAVVDRGPGRLRDKK